MQILWKSMMPGMMLTLYFKACIMALVHRTALFSVSRVSKRDFICVHVHDEIDTTQF
jgi:hypothetical protein